MDQKTLQQPRVPSNMLDLLVAMIADAVADRLRTSAAARRYYTRRDPPTAEKWTTILARAKRSGVPTVRQGREIHVDAAAWDAMVASSATKRPTLTSGDAAALEALGLRVGGGR